LAGHAFASVLRAAGEEPGSQAGVCDECGGDAELRLRIAEWRRPSERAIAFRLWTATLYPVEIAVGQSFGEPQPPPLARSAHELRSRGSARWQGILQEFWEHDSARENLQLSLRKFCAAHGGSCSSKETANGLRALLQSGETNPPMRTCSRALFRQVISNGKNEQYAARLDYI